MRWKVDLRRLSRGLRFRLTASYALFFALILIAVAALFWQRLENVLEKRVHETLEDRWATIKGYMRIERDPDTNKTSAFWYYDTEDPDETRIVLNLKKIHLVADQNGALIPEPAAQGDSVSTEYREEIGIDSPAEIRARVRESLAHKSPEAFWTVRGAKDGSRYLVRSGIVYNEAHTAPYYVAVGEPLEQTNLILTEFTWVYAGIIPAALVLGSLLGWFMAGRALTPVRDVAQTAQRISGSNLNLRIPTRQADDELDYLILTFNRMIARLEASFQQMKQFSTDASHELRTPITAIRGQLEVALFTARTTEQYREAIFNALQDIDRLSQIVRALLLLSQAESGQLVLQKTRLDLCSVAADLVDQFQIPAEEAGVHLTADLPKDCFAEADRVQIERLITNLLSNAIKFTPRGGYVRLALRHTGGDIEIDVQDSGRGIPTEHLSHIFDRFYRVPGSRGPGPEEGLGLGLSFVSWIVKAHNGTVDVESTPGKGTRFRIKLPDAVARPAEQEQSPQPVT